MSPIGSSSSIYQPAPTQNAQPRPPASSPSETPQDTVHLSKAALAAQASGDVDHDGDSH
jgi:hypothetical protein